MLCLSMAMFNALALVLLLLEQGFCQKKNIGIHTPGFMAFARGKFVEAELKMVFSCGEGTALAKAKLKNFLKN